MEKTEVSRWAKYLDDALLEAREVDRISTTEKFTLDEAYLIQDAGIRLRESRGEKLVGLKMGLTSHAKREQMGLHSPIYGVLLDRMQVLDGARFPLRGRIHPKIEPEIAFLISRDVRGRVTPAEALQACSGVCAAMEILDSRFLNFKYFSLEDVVADNSSSSHFVLSKTWSPLAGLDLASLEMVMEVDGQPVQSASSSAISGNPVNSLVQLCELLDSRGLYLKAGSIVLAGAATQAVQLAAGNQVRLRVSGLGEVSVTVTA